MADSYTVAITGASGLIGRHLCDQFRRAGHGVRALMRDVAAYPFGDTGIQRFAFNAPDAVPRDAFRAADVVIHCAYATRSGSAERSRQVNEDGTRRVLDAAREAGARRFVFVSSLAAHADAISYYGRSKLTIEQWLDPARDLIVRPGLVLANDGGLAHRMWRTLAATRLAPVFGGGDQIVQTVHIADLCTAFSRAVDRDLTGTLDVAEPDGLPMREFLGVLAAASGVRAVPLPLPTGTLIRMLRLTEALRLPLPVTSDNLLGLSTMRHVDTRPSLERLGLRLRDARESVSALMTQRTSPGAG
jgi:nucleoside-diphosphate-sugar epimerase